MGQYANQPDFGTEAKRIVATDEISLATNINQSCIYVGTGGDIRVILSGTTGPDGGKPILTDGVTFKNMPSGSFLPVICDYVLAGGTTATHLVAVK